MALIGYAVMAHPTRSDDAHALVGQLPAGTPIAWSQEPYVSATDRTSVWRTKAAALRLLAGHDFRCVLQEDIELAPDFLARLERTVADGGDRVVYALHFRVTGKQKRENLELARQARAAGASHFQPLPGYIRGQGIVVPDHYVPDLLEFGDRWSAEHPMQWDDDVMKAWLRDRRIPTYAPLPSLVEHTGGLTSVVGMKGDRRAWWFAA